jgi:hypothetical protein
MVIVRWCSVEWSSHLGYVDVDNFLSIGVVDRAKVKRVAVLAVIHMWPIIHKSLLETDVRAKSLVIANCPRYVQSVVSIAINVSTLTIAIDLVHIFWWDSNDTALLNHLGIFPNNRLHDLKVFHSNLFAVSTIRIDYFVNSCAYQGLYTIFLFPADNLAGAQIDNGFEDFTSSSDAYYICNTSRSRCVLGVFDPFHHLRLAGLP